MTFYLQPPSGNVPYEKLEDYALNRLRFLLRLNACKDEEERKETVLDAEVVNWSECLMAGNIKDKVSHYILRLNLAYNTDASRFLCNAEATLFRMRLDNFSIQEWVSFFKSLRRNVSRYHKGELNNLCAVLDSLRECECESWLLLAERIKTKDTALCIHLPFELLLRLVSKRLVILKEGYAAVPYLLIPDVLEEQFHNIMTIMLHQVSQEAIRSDARMKRLSAILMRAFEGEVHPTLCIPMKSKAVSLETILSSRPHFPPCMRTLLKQLQAQHRLRHHDRIQLTLFLKELGLPIHQALLFWKREYSKPAEFKSHMGCQHDWQGNERRYIYNIRHLYGLEGRRVSYAAHTCASIQGRQLTCNDHGGCPFTSLERSELNDHLTTQGFIQSDIEDIVDCVNRKCVERACGLYIHRNVKVALKTVEAVQNLKTKTDVICSQCLNCKETQSSENCPKVCDHIINKTLSEDRHKQGCKEKYSSESKIDCAFVNEFGKKRRAKRQLSYDHLQWRKRRLSSAFVTLGLDIESEAVQSINHDIPFDEQPAKINYCHKSENRAVAKLLADGNDNGDNDDGDDDDDDIHEDLRTGEGTLHYSYNNQPPLDNTMTCCNDKMTGDINVNFTDTWGCCHGNKGRCKDKAENEKGYLCCGRESGGFNRITNWKKPSAFYWYFNNSIEDG